MTAERKGASFNPDEAGGGFDKGRVTITNPRVDYFDVKKGKMAGSKMVALFLDFARADGGDTIPVQLLIGNAEEWAPNGAKTEAIPSREDGKFWNKSDLVRFMVSLVNAGFPKSRMGADFSVLGGLDVDVERVAVGGTHKDAEGKERPNTALLVTKIHTSQADLNSGAYSKNTGGASKSAVKSAVKPAAKPAATASAAPASDNDLRIYTKGLLVEILNANGGTFAKSDIHKPAYIAVTKAKKQAQRNDIIALLQDQAFIDECVGEELIVDDGETLAAAA